MLSDILQNVISHFNIAHHVFKIHYRISEARFIKWMIDIIAYVEQGYLSVNLAKYDTLERNLEKDLFYHKWKKMMAEKW